MRLVVLMVSVAACAEPAPAVMLASAPLPVAPSPPAPTPVASENVPDAGPVASASAMPPPPPVASAAAAGSSCPEGEVPVPPTGAAGFVMGKGIKGEHRVVLTHGFCMDASEVTVRDYARCVESGACKEPSRGDPWSTYPARLEYPVNMVSWSKAHAFCAWAGKRLPTEAEWEWAATGRAQTRYPWGDEPEPSCEYADYTKYGAPKWEAGGDIGCGGGGPSPVGSHPKGDKVWPGGVIHDLAGNVWEWVEDSFGSYALDTRAVDPVLRLDVTLHGIRGGGWNRSYAAMVVTYRTAAHHGYEVPALGFRCVRGEPLATPSPVYE